MAVAAIGSGAFAQGRGRGRGRNVQQPPQAQAPSASQVITIPIVEAHNMMQRQRVWLFTPPAGTTAFGMGRLSGQGYRLWALLPGCRRPNPDDPRDPCPVGRVAVEVISGSGTVQITEPQTVTDSPDARRVQSILIPNTVTQVRFRILRPNDSVRYEAAVESAQLPQLGAPDGTVGGPRGFTFELSHYPSL